MIVPAQRKWL